MDPPGLNNQLQLQMCEVNCVYVHPKILPESAEHAMQAMIFAV